MSRQRERVASLLLSLLILFPLIARSLPAMAADLPDRWVSADNSLEFKAIHGVVRDEDPRHAKVTVENRHEFWTNIKMDNGVGVHLAPSGLIGNLYATLGVIGPEDEAAWEGTFDTRGTSDQFIKITPTLAESGSLTAGMLNILTGAMIMLDGAKSPTASLPDIIKAVEIAEKAQSLRDAVRSLETHDLPGVAKGLYETLTDKAQIELLREALSLLGMKVSEEVLERLNVGYAVITSLDLVKDESWALIRGTYAGTAHFNNIASPTDGWLWAVDTFNVVVPHYDSFKVEGYDKPVKVIVDGQTVVDTERCGAEGATFVGFGDHTYRVGHRVGTPVPDGIRPALGFGPIPCSLPFIASATGNIPLTLTPTSNPTTPPTIAPTPSATATPTAVPLPTASYQNVSFSYDPAIAKSVTGITSPAGTPAGLPALAYPQHVLFTFTGYPLDVPNFPPLGLHVYPLGDYRALSSRAQGDSDKLRTLLETRPDLAATYSPPYIGDLRLSSRPAMPPFLPHPNASIYFVAKPQYVDFQGGSGIRYITAIAGQQFPISQTSPTQFFYTFQGLTTDGSSYIAAEFPVSVSAALDPAPASTVDVDTISAHNERVVGQLGQADNDKYTPNLSMLDGLIRSVKVAAPAVQATSPSPTPIQAPTAVAPVTGQLAYVSPEGDLAVANPNGTQVRKLVSGPVASPVWSHDGTKIAYLRRLKERFTSQIEVVNADGSGRTVAVSEKVNPRDVNSAPQAYVRVRWGDENTILYYAYSYGNSSGRGIIRRDMKSGAERDLNIYAWDFDIAKDGTIVTQFYDNSIGTTRIALDPPAGKEQLLVSGSVVQGARGATVISVDYPTWSPDGSRIAFLTGDGIRIVGRDGRQIRTLAVTQKEVANLAWGADGVAIFFSARADTGDIALFRIVLSDGKAQRLFRGSDPAVHP